MHQKEQRIYRLSDRELAANLLGPLWVGELSSPPLLSPIVEDHPVKRAGKLPPSRQAKAGPDYPARTSGTSKPTEHKAPDCGAFTWRWRSLHDGETTNAVQEELQVTAWQACAMEEPLDSTSWL